MLLSLLKSTYQICIQIIKLVFFVQDLLDISIKMMTFKIIIFTISYNKNLELIITKIKKELIKVCFLFIDMYVYFNIEQYLRMK